MDVIIADKRERILKAASELIVKNGLQCSMSEIAQTAGVATGSLYNYFTSKDDLIRGVYHRLTDEVAAVLIVEHAPHVSHEKRIRRYIDDYIDFIWADANRAILFEYLSNVPLLRPGDLRSLFAPVTDFTARLFHEAQEAGVLRDFDIHQLSGFIGGGIRNTLKWRRNAGSPLTLDERHQIAEMCWSAVARK